MAATRTRRRVRRVTVGRALEPLELRALILRGAVCSAMKAAGLAYREPRWQWDGDYPEPCLRIASVIVRWNEVAIRSEEIRVSGFDKLVPEGTWCVDDAEVAEVHNVTLKRNRTEWPDVDADLWWDAIGEEFGSFGDVVLADEPRNLVSIEEGAW